MNKAEKAKGGRPRHEPTPKDRQIVEVLSGVGVPQNEICSLIGISLPTLHRCYRRELNQGAARVQLRMIHNLFRLAEGKGASAVKAVTFILQCRFGWSLYAPPPSEKQLGKKLTAELEAQSAHEGTSWGDLLH